MTVVVQRIADDHNAWFEIDQYGEKIRTLVIKSPNADFTGSITMTDTQALALRDLISKEIDQKVTDKEQVANLLAEVGRLKHALWKIQHNVIEATVNANKLYAAMDELK